tara:strand:- start:2490 stop:3161 length:672 start_codon:yes stop_codon:yes gene_type:complete
MSGAILAKLGDLGYRWVASLANKLDKPADELAEEMGSKLINLEKQAPEMFTRFEPESLKEVLVEANKGDSDIVLMDPEKFRELAATIDINNPVTAQGVRNTVDEYIEDIKFNLPLRNTLGNVPYLQYKMPDGNIAQVIAHDGRHRNRALEELGNLQSLVRIAPTFDDSTPALSKLDQPVDVYSEISPMQKAGAGGKKVGSSKDLFKFLSVFGALPFLGKGDDE